MGKLHIEMLGTNFTIQANENTEYLEKLLSYYKKFTDDVNKIDSIKSPLQVAIVSGIMLCDELYKEKSKTARFSQSMTTDSDSEASKLAEDMIRKLDAAISQE